MTKKLTRKNLIDWARDLYRDDGEFEYWYDLSASSYRPTLGHDCGCVLGELARDFHQEREDGSFTPLSSMEKRVSELLGTHGTFPLIGVNDDAPAGPARAKAVQKFMLERLGAKP